MIDTPSADDTPTRPLAVVTGASSGIGLELARLCARDGHDLIIAADDGPLGDVAAELRELHVNVQTVAADLATADGVARVVDAIGERAVAVLMANAGHGLGRAFLDQDFAQVRHVINTNITGTLDLIRQVGLGMRARNFGHILVTGSIAGLMPGAYQAVYNGTKAFIDSFCYALRSELADHGVSVTCLMPGVTDTHFFERAGLMDTRLARGRKADPADVARAGFDAMRDGDSDVVAGWKAKLQVILANVTPPEVLAEQHRRLAKPGSARR